MNESPQAESSKPQESTSLTTADASAPTAQGYKPPSVGKPAGPGIRPLIKSQPAQARVQRTSLVSRLPQREAPKGPIEDWTNAVFRPDLYQPPVLRNKLNDAGRVDPVLAASDNRQSTPGVVQAKKEAGAMGASAVRVEPAKHAGGPLQQPSDSGKAMPEDIRAKMESALGADFSQVRIHEGPHAETLGAVAFAQGTNIHFAPGRYNPATTGGQELLGHELTHVVQQTQGRVPATKQDKGIPVNDDVSLEREADTLGAKAARGERDNAENGMPTPAAGAPSVPGQYEQGAQRLIQRQEQCQISEPGYEEESQECPDPRQAYQSALQALYSRGGEFDCSQPEFQDYCAAREQLICSNEEPPPEPLAIALPSDQVMALSDDGQLLMLPIPEEYYQVDDQLITMLDEVSQLGLGVESVSVLPVGEPLQMLLWEDGRAVRAPAISADFWELMAQGSPVETQGLGGISSPAFSDRPWSRVRDSGIHGLFGMGVYQLGTYPISRFQGVALPAGSRIRFADPRFPIHAQTRVMTIFVPGTNKYYAWDLHSLPVGSGAPPTWHVNQKGMSAGLFGQSDHSPMTPAQIRQGRALRYMRIGGRIVLIVGVAVDSWNLGSSIMQSVEEGTPAPAVAETIRIAGGWGGAWAGVKLGCGAGALAGIETGPGAAVTCIVGGFIGGVAGYAGADWIADLIDED